MTTDLASCQLLVLHFEFLIAVNVCYSFSEVLAAYAGHFLARRRLLFGNIYFIATYGAVRPLKIFRIVASTLQD